MTPRRNLPLSAEVYRKLLTAARKAGTTPSRLLDEWAEQIGQAEYEWRQEKN